VLWHVHGPCAMQPEADCLLMLILPVLDFRPPPPFLTLVAVRFLTLRPMPPVFPGEDCTSKHVGMPSLLLSTYSLF